MYKNVSALAYGTMAVLISLTIATGVTAGPVQATRGGLPSEGSANSGMGRLTVSPLTVASGGRITLTLAGFASGKFTIMLNSLSYGAVTLPKTGTFSLSMAVASTIPAGMVTVAAVSADGKRISTRITVAGTLQQNIPAPKPVSAGIPQGGRTANGCTITAAQAVAEQQILSLLNTHRAAAGDARLTLNPTLSLAARAHSCEMFHLNTLQHLSADGSSPATRFKLPGMTVLHWAENVGNGPMMGNDALTVINQLDAQMMAEPNQTGTHRANIVSRASTGVGVGVIIAQGQVWLTEDFVG